MALYIKDAYANVFDPKVNDKFVNANLSTGRKDKDQNGNTIYVNSYWSSTFVGSAFEKAKTLKNKDNIKILSGIMKHEKSNKLDANGKPVYYYNLIIFNFDIVIRGESVPTSSSTSDTEVSSSDDDLPF